MLPALCLPCSARADEADSAISSSDEQTEAGGSSDEDPAAACASAALNEGVALRPAACRFYAQIGRVCGHCPNCPFAVLLLDSDFDEDDGHRRRAAVHVRARPTAPAPRQIPLAPSRAAHKGPPRLARYRGIYPR